MKIVELVKEKASKYAVPVASAVAAVAPYAVSAQGAEASVASDIVSTSATLGTGIVSNLGTLTTALSGNPLVIISLGVAFFGLAGRYLLKWITSIFIR